MYRFIGRLFAGLSVLIGMGYLFGTTERLGMHRGRGGNFGEMFLGLAVLFGEMPARLILGSLFLILGWLFWKAQAPNNRQRSEKSRDSKPK